MFKNRAMQVKLVKTPEQQKPETTRRHLVVNLNEALNQTKKIAALGVAAAVALKVTDAACKIAVHIATK